MVEQGKALTAAETRAVAMFVTAKPFGEVPGHRGRVSARIRPPAFDQPLSGPHWNGWGVDMANRRMQPAAMAGLSVEQVARLKVKWAFGFPGGIRALAQPTVAGGRIFVGSDSGKVYSLDAVTGCTYWTFKADADGSHRDQHRPVGRAMDSVFWRSGSARLCRRRRHRRAIMEGASGTTSGGHDYRRSGALRWTAIRSLYIGIEEVGGANLNYECCKFRGGVTALDAATGKQIWKSYTIPEDSASGSQEQERHPVVGTIRARACGRRPRSISRSAQYM